MVRFPRTRLFGKQTGVVKFFDQSKGYGFIVNNAGGQDIYVQRNSILSEGFKSLLEGTAVEFDTSIDSNGRVRAENVSQPGGAPFQRNVRCTGKVKFFSDPRGYGYIIDDGTGEEIFFHRTSIVNSKLVPIGEGDEVEFEILSNNMKGKVSAGNVVMKHRAEESNSKQYDADFLDDDAQFE